MLLRKQVPHPTKSFDCDLNPSHTVESWISSVPYLKTKKLRMDEIEALNGFNPKDSVISSVFDFSCEEDLENISQPQEQFKLTLSALNKEFDVDEDDSWKWSLKKVLGDSITPLLRDARLDNFNEVSEKQDEFTVFNTRLPKHAGVRYYDYTMPHLKINQLICPRRFSETDEGECSSESQSESEEQEQCQNLQCSICEEHHLLTSFDHWTFPKSTCEFLLESSAIEDDTEKRVGAVKCHFCPSFRKGYSKTEHLIHLQLAHGIIVSQDSQDITLLAHPKALFEQLTSDGYFTTCLCPRCNVWLSLKLQDTKGSIGGLFEPYWIHIKDCQGPRIENQ